MQDRAPIKLLPIFLALCFFTLGQTAHGSKVRSTDLLNSQTNLPIYFLDLDKFTVETRSYDGDEILVDWYTKRDSTGVTEGKINVQRAQVSWWGVGVWQSAQQLDSFKERMRKRNRYINMATADIITHRFGGDYGFSAIEGKCIFSRWAFNLRGMSPYDNDEGAPDTIIELNGCNLLNDDPEKVFKKIREMDEEFRSQLMQMISNDSSNKNKSDTATKTEPPKKVQDGATTLISGSKEAKLKEAKDLFEKELINENEYEKLKKQILGID